MIVRELTGGIYFGEPRGWADESGLRRGFNTDVYDEAEIRRIAHLAFQFARKRGGRLCSVDKANVLEVTMLWREIVSELASGIQTSTLVICTSITRRCSLFVNPSSLTLCSRAIFGDILSDTAAMLTGSIGMLPSASLNSESRGLYEPVHGSAPDIAGQGKANPLATILSAAMLFVTRSMKTPRLSQSKPRLTCWIVDCARVILQRPESRLARRLTWAMPSLQRYAHLKIGKIMKTFNVAIVGATGAVGEVLLELIESRNFPVNNLYLLASERSAGTTLSFKGKRITVQNLAELIFRKLK